MSRVQRGETSSWLGVATLYGVVLGVLVIGLGVLLPGPGLLMGSLAALSGAVMLVWSGKVRQAGVGLLAAFVLLVAVVLLSVQGDFLPDQQ